jgi:hypothetical protein
MITGNSGGYRKFLDVFSFLGKHHGKHQLKLCMCERKAWGFGGHERPPLPIHYAFWTFVGVLDA